jgi:hypothetical protein
LKLDNPLKCSYFVPVMSTATNLTLEPAADPADWSRSMAEEHRAILGRVARLGEEMLEALVGQAKGGAVVVQGDVALAFDRVARAVRLTLALRTKLIEDLRERQTAQAARKASAQAGAARILRDVIDDERADKERTERLTAEAAERLRAEDFGDRLSRPFGEVVAGICRALGVKPDWLKLAEDCCKVEASLDAKPGQMPEPPDEDIKYEVKWLSDYPRPYDPSRPRDSS